MGFFFWRKRGTDVRTARAQMDAGEAIVLDVREPNEWKAAHIKAAIHIPLGDLGQRQNELPRDQRLLAICRSGTRSAMATSALRKAGYTVENVEGGMKAWVAAGNPIQPSDGRIV